VNHSHPFSIYIKYPFKFPATAFHQPMPDGQSGMIR